MNAPATPPHLEQHRLWWSWTASCGAGELIGMSIAAGFAATINQIVGQPASVQLRLLVLAVIPANAVGWAVALDIIFLAATIPRELWSIIQVGILGMVTGVLAGLSIGAITGIGLIVMTRQ